MAKLQSTTVSERFFNDIRFRSDVSLYQGLLINLLYIGMKLFSGIYYRSVWFIALAVYYMLLAVMCFILLRKGKKKTGRTPIEIELLRYRACGIMLLIMNQELAGIVVGIISTLILGLGMSCAMVWTDTLFIPGIIIGIIGIIGVIVTYPIYNRITKKRREKLVLEIMR